MDNYALNSAELAPNLAIRASYAVHRDNGFSSEANELRFVVDYPLDIF